MSTTIILITTILILLWIFKESKFRVNGIVSADILVASFFIIYISAPLLMFSVFSPYPKYISLNFFLFSFLCLCFFVAPWQFLYPRKLLLSSTLPSRYSSFASSHFLRTNWSVYLIILSLSSFSHLLVNPAEYGLVQGGSFAIALFFVRLVRPLLILSVVLWFQRKVKSHLMFVVYISLLTLPFIVTSGRRSDTFFLAIIFAVAAVITGKIRFPRFAILFFIIAGLFVFNFLPLIRGSSSEQLVTKKYNAYSPLDALIIKYTAFSEESEAAYAALQFQVSSESGLIDTFAPVFNAFSNQFISATLFGEEVKEAATIPMYSFADRCERSKFCQNYSIPDFWWYAPTGFLEAYQMLSYGGCFLFSLAGYLIFRYSVLAEFAQISYGSASPYLVVLISLAPLVVYTGISYFVLQLTIYLLVIRLSSIQPV